MNNQQLRTDRFVIVLKVIFLSPLTNFFYKKLYIHTNKKKLKYMN